MYDDIFLDIDRILFSNKKIGIFVSGGFDSTLLSYLLHLERDRLKTENTFEFFTVPRYDDSVVHATRIVKYIDEKFNETSTPINIVGDPDLHHSEQVRSGIHEAGKRADFDLILAADTCNPTDIPDGPNRKRGTTRRYYQPFFDYTKDKTVGLCIYLGLTDIMEIAHTCTESKTLRCNSCWQCRERAWAFKECNYIDPGLL